VPTAMSEAPLALVVSEPLRRRLLRWNCPGCVRRHGPALLGRERAPDPSPTVAVEPHDLVKGVAAAMTWASRQLVTPRSGAVSPAGDQVAAKAP